MVNQFNKRLSQNIDQAIIEKMMAMKNNQNYNLEIDQELELRKLPIIPSQFDLNKKDRKDPIVINDFSTYSFGHGQQDTDGELKDGETVCDNEKTSQPQTARAWDVNNSRRQKNSPLSKKLKK